MVTRITAGPNSSTKQMNCKQQDSQQLKLSKESPSTLAMTRLTMKLTTRWFTWVISMIPSTPAQAIKTLHTILWYIRERYPGMARAGRKSFLILRIHLTQHTAGIWKYCGKTMMVPELVVRPISIQQEHLFTVQCTRTAPHGPHQMDRDQKTTDQTSG